MVVFVDEILIYSRSREEHEKRLHLESSVICHVQQKRILDGASVIHGACYLEGRGVCESIKDRSSRELAATNQCDRSQEFLKISQLLSKICAEFLRCCSSSNETDQEE